MAISKFQNLEILTPKISKKRYFWESLFFLKFEKSGLYVIEPHIYYLHANF